VSFLKTVKRGAMLAKREATQVVDMGYGSDYRTLFYGGTGKDWRAEAGDIHANSAVAIALGTQLDKMAQGRIRAVTVAQDGSLKPQEAETLALNVLNLTPLGTRWIHVLVASLKLTGMAYMVKIRQDSGNPRSKVIGYIPFFSSQVQRDSSGSVVRYLITLHGGSSKQSYFNQEDVIPIGYGIPDPRDPTMSISPLMMCLREVASDNHCATFIASVLGNMGFPGAIVSPANPINENMQVKWANRVREALRTYTRDRRGEPYVAPEPLNVQQVAFDASQMQVVEFDKISIHKLCGALGVDPMAVGLPSSENKKFNSYPEARKAMIEDAILPLWSVILNAIEPHFKSDGFWVGTGASKQMRMVVDEASYPELREDKYKVTEDVERKFKSNIISRGRALELLGEPAETDKRLYVEILAELKMASAGGRARYLAREHERLEKLHADSDA
jgi:hypothetical protein